MPQKSAVQIPVPSVVVIMLLLSPRTHTSTGGAGIGPAELRGFRRPLASLLKAGHYLLATGSYLHRPIAQHALAFLRMAHLVAHHIL